LRDRVLKFMTVTITGQNLQLMPGSHICISGILIFPDFPISDLIPQLIEKGMLEGTRQMLRELKANLAKNQ